MVTGDESWFYAFEPEPETVINRMGVPKLDKSSKSCSQKNYFEANGSLFLQNI